MLVNLEFDPERLVFDPEKFDEDFLNDLGIKQNIKQKDILIKLKDGVYQYWDVNSIILPNYNIDDWIRDKDGHLIKMLPYGVADNVEQILERDWNVKSCIADKKNEYILQVCWISKYDQPEHGGWRWHKWGDYIGDFVSKCEYLYDEEGIDGVFVYKICSVEKL